MIGQKEVMRSARFFLPLVGLICLAVAIRIFADGAGNILKPYMATYYPVESRLIAELPFWRWFLPIEQFSGRWGTTGFLLVNWLESLIGEPSAFYLLTAMMVTSGYIFSYLVFRSLSLSILFGLALASTTFNYHVYIVPGSVIMLPLLTFLFVFAYCHVTYVRAERAAIWWFFLTGLSCILLAFCYEGWLDVVPLIWIADPVLAWLFWRRGRRERAARCLSSFAIVSAVAIAYVATKMYFGLNGLHPVGGEGDLVVRYGTKHAWLIIEDIISSYFTFFFTAVSTYFPPQFLSFSQSSLNYGTDTAIKLQEGYHPQATHLTAYNHLFLWRYYAGLLFGVISMLFVRVAKQLSASLDRNSITYFVLLLAVLVGSPTHLIIKWRPMHAAPFLGYQVYLSVVGAGLLICFFFDQLGSLRGLLLRVLLGINLLYCAYARPALLSHMSQQAFMGSYPDPRENLKNENLGTHFRSGSRQ